LKLKFLIITFIFFSCLFQSFGWEKRDLLRNATNLSSLKKQLVLNQKWVKYPSYLNRKGWDDFTGSAKESIIKRGETALNYQWQLVKATDYLQFDRTGERYSMETIYNANSNAFADLMLAELAEGKGRFMDQIINGIWYYCEMSSWAISAHVARGQSVKSSLPNEKENVIELISGETGAMLAWAHYFFKDEMDKAQPMISSRLKENIQKRIMDSFMNRSDFWWQAFDASPSTSVNNWNPWCNYSVLQCFLLLENDPEKLAKAVYRTMLSTDAFINYNHDDGACEEGPSYWSLAAGKLYEYLSLLKMSTDNKVSIFNQPIVKNLGEYIAHSYVGNGWVVNFADASPKGGDDAELIYRFGNDINSATMVQFASFLNLKSSKEFNPKSNSNVLGVLEKINVHPSLMKQSSAIVTSKYTWYPQTQFCYMRRPSLFFAAIGGHNNESHNHNDVGSFMLYCNTVPIFIDAGVGTYTKQTFSDKRYDIWTMQSKFHNTPSINGYEQSPGAEFKANNVIFDASKSIFSVDIAAAYPKEASVKSWKRTYKIESDEKITITDAFELDEIKQKNQLNFLTWAKPDISKKGLALIEKYGAKLQLEYDSKEFDCTISEVKLSDKRLSGVWGESIYQLTLTAKKTSLKGKYSCVIKKY
jgi:hypothetical protein